MLFEFLNYFIFKIFLMFYFNNINCIFLLFGLLVYNFFYLYIYGFFFGRLCERLVLSRKFG